MECSYCKKEFFSKSYLTYHQKNARYCLKIQGNSDKCKFKCYYCNKILSKKKLKTHYEICKEFSKDKLENIAIKAVQRNFDHETTINIESDSDTESDSDIDYESECESKCELQCVRITYKLTPLEVGNTKTKTVSSM